LTVQKLKSTPKRTQRTFAALALNAQIHTEEREGDMLVELMQRAKALDTPADWLVRAKHNRCLPDGDKLWARTCAGEALGQIVFTMPSRHGQKERKVRQERLSGSRWSERRSVTIFVCGASETFPWRRSPPNAGQERAARWSAMEPSITETPLAGLNRNRP
jgi:hypothetical protein